MFYFVDAILQFLHTEECRSEVGINWFGKLKYSSLFDIRREHIFTVINRNDLIKVFKIFYFDHKIIPLKLVLHNASQRRFYNFLYSSQLFINLTLLCFFQNSNEKRPGTGPHPSIHSKRRGKNGDNLCSMPFCNSSLDSTLDKRL